MTRAFHLLMIIVMLSSCDGDKASGYWGNEADMRGYFEGASTPEIELEASKEMNKRFRGYTVTAFNVAGTEIFPQRDGDYGAIHRVTIAFANSDVVASRVILNRDSLTYIYGE